MISIFQRNTKGEPKLPLPSEKGDKRLNLSNSGRVVVIDDEWPGVEVLVKSLAKLGVPYYYFDGSIDDLPANPIEGIRFVFLDIELADTRGADDKNKASALAARIFRIVGEGNGPYFIVFWTQHSEVIPYVLEYLAPKAPPVQWINLEKPNKNAPGDEWSIQAVTRKIEDKLNNIGAFRLYVEWENILNLAGAKFVNDFSSLVPRDPDNPTEWSIGTSTLFHKLYSTYSGSSAECSAEDKFRGACTLLNQSFSDTLQRATQKGLTLPSGFDLKGGKLADNVIPKINTALFIDSSGNSSISTGSIIFLDDEQFSNDLQKAIFKNGKAPGDLRLCSVIVTPECDLAHNKIFCRTENGNESICHRLLYGLCFPSVGNLDKICIEKGRDARFVIEPFWHEGKSKTIIFHFGTLSKSHKIEQSGTPAFSLRRDLIFDLQSKAANHVNRLGNYQLKS
jgi:hypothetical protein